MFDKTLATAVTMGYWEKEDVGWRESEEDARSSHSDFGSLESRYQLLVSD